MDPVNEPLAPTPSADIAGESPHDPRLKEVETWVFDLDNTLYPPSSNLFEQIDVRIGMFLQEFLSLGPGDARTLQKQYFRTYGTTLHGLIQNHGTDPWAFRTYGTSLHRLIQWNRPPGILGFCPRHRFFPNPP